MQFLKVDTVEPGCNIEQTGLEFQRAIKVAMVEKFGEGAVLTETGASAMIISVSVCKLYTHKQADTPSPCNGTTYSYSAASLPYISGCQDVKAGARIPLKATQ